MVTVLMQTSTVFDAKYYVVFCSVFENFDVEM